MLTNFNVCQSSIISDGTSVVGSLIINEVEYYFIFITIWLVSSMNFHPFPIFPLDCCFLIDLYKLFFQLFMLLIFFLVFQFVKTLHMMSVFHTKVQCKSRIILCFVIFMCLFLESLPTPII